MVMDAEPFVSILATRFVIMMSFGERIVSACVVGLNDTIVDGTMLQPANPAASTDMEIASFTIRKVADFLSFCQCPISFDMVHQMNKSHSRFKGKEAISEKRDGAMRASSNVRAAKAKAGRKNPRLRRDGLL